MLILLLRLILRSALVLLLRTSLDVVGGLAHRLAQFSLLLLGVFLRLFALPGFPLTNLLLWRWFRRRRLGLGRLELWRLRLGGIRAQRLLEGILRLVLIGLRLRRGFVRRRSLRVFGPWPTSVGRLW